jgi:hypothetical protein
MSGEVKRIQKEEGIWSEIAQWLLGNLTQVLLWEPSLPGWLPANRSGTTRFGCLYPLQPANLD